MATHVPTVLRPTPDDMPTGVPPVPCAVCGRTIVGGPHVCFCCRLVARQLGLPLAPVVVTKEYRVGDADHRSLRGYKDSPVSAVRAGCRDAIVSELTTWLCGHGGVLADRLGPWSVVATVPSTRRSDAVPAGVLVDGVPALAERHVHLLGRGSGEVDHLSAARDGFAVLPGVDLAALRRTAVLVFDDTVTTGARAQSAAAALRLAGARVVGILAVGRALAPHPELGQARPGQARPGD